MFKHYVIYNGVVLVMSFDVTMNEYYALEYVPRICSISIEGDWRVPVLGMRHPSLAGCSGDRVSSLVSSLSCGVTESRAPRSTFFGFVLPRHLCATLRVHIPD